jgi:hypothetical protein
VWRHRSSAASGPRIEQSSAAISDERVVIHNTYLSQITTPVAIISFIKRR